MSTRTRSALQWIGGQVSKFANFNVMPILAITLLFSLLAALLWILYTHEQEQARLDLVRDTLWVERALQFQVSGDDETLQRLADDLGQAAADPAAFPAQARQLLTRDPSLLSIDWREANGSVKFAVPQHGVPWQSASAEEVLLLREAAESGRRADSLISTRPFAHGAGAAFAHVAQMPGAANAGAVLVATISLDRMLSQNIPWWIAEKRGVEIRDHEGHLLAARSQAAFDMQGLNHTIAFGVQPAGLFITLLAGPAPTNLTRDGLVGAIVILGLLAVGGLWAREAHLRKRRKAEADLRSEHAFRKAMEDSLSVGMRARDLRGQVIYVNQSFCRMLGWTREELVGRVPPMPYWLPDDMERTTEFHNKVMAGAPPTEGIELRFQRRDGSRLVALVQEAPLIGVNGQQTGWMGSFLDITERKAAEDLSRQQADQLETTSRMVLVGEMASILAHDLNQPLATITSYQTGLVNRVMNGSIGNDEILTTLTKMGDAAHRAGQIVHRVQDVVKRNEPRFGLIDIAELTERTVAMFQSEPRPSSTRIAISAAPRMLVERCDDVLIEQVLINLLRNAEESMAGLPRRDRLIDVRVAAFEAEVEVRIADRGPGIPAAMEGDIFRPFVSTKRGGMGLGLTICRSVLEAHRSRLTCSPREGGGSIFSFRLAPLTP